MKKVPIALFVWIGAVVLFTVGIFSLFGEQGFLAVYKAHNQSRLLAQEIDKSKRTIDSLKKEIELLKSDTMYIERVAREKLGMARRNEKVFKFIEDK